jgi:hypothetical protein
LSACSNAHHQDVKKVRDVDYRKLVQELCETVGMHDWQEVARSGHICVDDTVIGLLFDGERAPDVLCLYFEFGQTRDDDTRIEALLIHNAVAAPPAGAFGLLPPHNTVVYRVNLDWSKPLSGSELVASIDFHLETARAAVLQNKFEFSV